MEKLDLDITSEFLIMAARLIQIKVRALLPGDQSEEEKEEHSEEEIRKQLIECKKYRDAALALRERLLKHSTLFARTCESMEEEEALKVTLSSLLTAFKGVMSREKRKERTLEVSGEKLNISKKIKELNEIFKRVSKVEFYNLLNEKRKIEVIITLLAILELVRLKKLSIHQGAPFSEIWITRP
jgi:segregation and condensation protein A